MAIDSSTFNLFEALIHNTMFGVFENTGVRSASQSIYGKSYLDGVVKDAFSDLMEKEAEYACEQIKEKYLKLVSDETLMNLFLAIKKELIDRTALDKNSKKEQ